MEHTLGALMAKSKSENIPVLILVLMEHTLGDQQCCYCREKRSLNPCSNGTYSRRLTPREIAKMKDDLVLILVLMEHTLGGVP